MYKSKYNIDSIKLLYNEKFHKLQISYTSKLFAKDIFTKIYILQRLV